MYHWQVATGDQSFVDEGLEILSEEECLLLAATRPVGRVAVSVAALPAVFPVNFCLVGRQVFFRTTQGTKLAAAAHHAVVAFEVDDFDNLGHTGWSVMLVGTAELVTPEELAGIGPLRVTPWARGDRDHVVRIRAELISGRRISTTVERRH